MLKIIWMMLVIAVLSTTGFAQTNVSDNRAMNHVFAQLADGRFADGTSYRSTFIISADDVEATCIWQFYRLTLPGLGDGITVLRDCAPRQRLPSGHAGDPGVQGGLRHAHV